MLTTIAGLPFAHLPLTTEKPSHTVSRLTVDGITCDVQVTTLSKRTCLALRFASPDRKPEQFVLSDRQVVMLYRETKKAQLVGLVVPHLARTAQMWREDGVLYEDQAA